MNAFHFINTAHEYMEIVLVAVSIEQLRSVLCCAVCNLGWGVGALQVRAFEFGMTPPPKCVIRLNRLFLYGRCQATDYLAKINNI